MGEQILDSGKITFRNDIRVAYLPQNPTMNPSQTLDSYIYSSENKYIQTVSAYEKALKDIEKEQDVAGNTKLATALVDGMIQFFIENDMAEIRKDEKTGTEYISINE